MNTVQQQADRTAGILPKGSYMLRAACVEKATGTVQIAVKPAADPD